MREIEINLGGRELKLAATFKASRDIAEKVADPMTIMREASLEAVFLSRGIPYEPKWRFTIENIVQILLIGLKTAGSSLKQGDVEDLVFEAGFLEAKEAAGNYLALIVGPRAEETVEGASSEGN